MTWADLVNIATVVLAIATLILAIAAIIAGILAWWNIKVLKKQRRVETLLHLVERMSSQEARDGRAKVHQLLESEPLFSIPENTDEGQRIALIIDYARTLKRGANPPIVIEQAKEQKDAIEETIANLDKVGFFLLGYRNVDQDLMNEAPTWIWSIANDMWEKLGKYVDGVQKGTLHRKYESWGKPSPNYGKYFRKLAFVAKKHEV